MVDLMSRATGEFEGSLRSSDCFEAITVETMDASMRWDCRYDG